MKKVTWAPGLCQGSSNGARSRCRHQPEMTQTARSNRLVSCLKKTQHKITKKWRRPPRFILCTDVPIAAGEQSLEKEAQRKRETTVLEALFPDPSVIPPSPASPAVEEHQYDDSLTPIISIIPIEEKEAMEESGNVESVGHISTVSDSVVLPQDLMRCPGQDISQYNGPAAPKRHPPGTSTGSEADVAAAASAACTALMKSQEQGSKVDMSLLINILNNPVMIEKLKNAGSVDAAKRIVMSESDMATPKVGLPTPELKFTQKPEPATGKPDILETVHETTSRLRGFPEPSKVSSFQLNALTIEPQTDAVITQNPVFHNENSVLNHELSFSNTSTSSTALSNEKPPAFLAHNLVHVNSSMPLKTLHESTGSFQSHLPALSVTVPPPSFKGTFSSTSPSFSYFPLSQNARPVDSSMHFQKLHTAPNSLPGLGSISPSPVPIHPSPVPMNPLSGTMDPKLQNPTSFNEWTEGPKGMTNATPGLVPQKVHHGLQSSLSPVPENVPAPLIAPHGKDVNYYKNLIKQHGKENGLMTQPQEQLNVNNTLKRKLCKYFNSPSGCRNGLSCRFLHEQSPNMGAGMSSEFNGYKRMKMTL